MPWWYLFLFSLYVTKTTCDVLVNVTVGKLIGAECRTIFEGKRFYAFYRVPYAQPPIRHLRFKNPVAFKKWAGRRDARKVYHGACAQAHIVHKHALFGNEDCLYMNIYTPHVLNKKTDDLKPVIVWVHGYAFTASFSHLHGADFFIDNDVLLVTVSHRIGPFGFLKVNATDSHANMGLKDIVMALKWIKKNINSFGGDEKRVTVMGSGSAATFLSWLMLTKARHLFSKMILQSGALFSASLYARQSSLELERLTKELQQLGVTKLKNSPAQKIITASQKIYNTIDFINYQRSLVPFAPIKEKKTNKSLVIIRPDEIYKKNIKVNISLPILVGYNSQESISEVTPFLQNPTYLKMFTSAFKFMVPFSDGCRHIYTSKQYGQIAMKIKNEYFHSGISEKYVNEFARYISDLHKYPMYKFMKTLLKLNSNKMFTYAFNYVGTFNSVRHTALAGTNVPIKGAASGDELCYLLMCEPMWEHYYKLKNKNTDNNTIMIKQMATWWTNFAKFGDPTPALLPSMYNWPPTSLNSETSMLIQRQSKLVHNLLDKKAYKFWDKVYDNHYKEENCDPKVRVEL